jgi:hypothetical protein
MARLNARRGGLLQRLSTGVLTEFVGGKGYLDPCLFQMDTDRDRGAIAFCPPGIDRRSWDGLVSSTNLLTQSIQQLGLAVIPVALSLSAVAFAVSIFRPDKDLQDDKEGYATAVVGKHNSNFT